METQIKPFHELSSSSVPPQLPTPWIVDAIVNDDNMTYIVANSSTREAILVDAMREDLPALKRRAQHYAGYRWLFVLDTHTHADHITSGPEMAHLLGAPWVQHEKSPSRRIDLRVSRDVTFPSQAGGLQILLTPGHTPDSLSILWGPVLLTGDTLLFNDTGRDDLPGGDPATHYESVEKYKKLTPSDTWVLFGHDAQGGRVDLWKNQLKTNPMLGMDRETFISEAGSYVGPSPKNLKESLFENFK